MPGLEAIILVVIIGIPIYFVWRWLLGKIMPAGRKHKTTTWIATIITAPIVYIGLIFLFILYMFNYPTRQFNKAAWASNKNRRYEYTGDLLKRKLLIGKSKAEVIYLLGVERNKLTSNYWVYEIGSVPSLGVDVDILEIAFENDKVIEVKQRGT